MRHLEDRLMFLNMYFKMEFEIKILLHTFVERLNHNKVWKSCTQVS